MRANNIVLLIKSIREIPSTTVFHEKRYAADLNLTEFKINYLLLLYYTMIQVFKTIRFEFLPKFLKFKIPNTNRRYTTPRAVTVSNVV